MIEIFKNPNYDFLGKAKYFIAFSVIISIAGFISMFARGFNMGVDFAGGTKVTVRFKTAPDENKVREALSKQNPKVFEKDKVIIQRTGKQLNQAERNEIFITTPLAEKKDILEALNKNYASTPVPAGMIDVNNNGASAIADALLEKDPLSLKTNMAPGDGAKEYARFAQEVVKYRDQVGGGLIADVNSIPLTGFDPKFGEAVKKTFFAGEFNIVSVDSVGPQVGKDLQKRAIYVTLLSCFGMLVFIAFRFERIYGVAAVIATLHDIIVTLGLFSLFQWEISLTFIAAMLTLIGYSMNDTIVIFDRIRETLKVRRREDLVKVTNDAINQTLSRTIIASGLTLLSVVALVVFGGEVLKSFSLCLLIGILIGTYSSIAVASPVVIWWKNREERLKAEEIAKNPTRASGGPKGAKSAPAAR